MPTPSPDPAAILRSRRYVGLLVLAAILGVPILPLIPGLAMGIGAMSVVMLNLPLTSVLLATLLLASDGLTVMPLVIVAVAVAYVASARLTPVPPPAPTAAPPAEQPDQAPRTRVQ